MSSKKADARERILEAAIGLFSKNGIHATTTRLIAQHAEVNEVTLFRNFKTKMDLFQEVLNVAKKEGFCAFKVIRPELAPEERLRFLVHNMVRILEERPEFHRIIYHALLDKIEGFEEEFLKEEQDLLMEHVTTNFLELKELGVVTLDEIPRDLARLLINNVFGVVITRTLLTTGPMTEVTQKQLCGTILNLYLR